MNLQIYLEYAAVATKKRWHALAISYAREPSQFQQIHNALNSQFQHSVVDNAIDWWLK